MLTPPFYYAIWSVIWSLHAADAEQNHADQDQQQVEGFGLEVALAKEEDAAKEGDYNRRAAYHRHHSNHAISIVEGMVVAEVGEGDKQRDKGYGPAPVEGLCSAAWQPYSSTNYTHHGELVDAKPTLHKDRGDIAPRYEELIVEATNCAKQHGGKHCPHIAVITEVYVLLSTRATQQIERDDGKQHTTPLPEVKFFTKEQYSTQQYNNGARGIHRAHDGERQVLNGVEATQPRRERNGGLKRYKQVLPDADVVAIVLLQELSTEPPEIEVCIEDVGQQQERRKEGIKQQHGDDGIARERALLGDIVEAKKHSREQRRTNPHTTRKSRGQQ